MADPNLPTADMAFGNNTPTADEAFGPSQTKPDPGMFSGEFADTFFSHDTASRVISAFGQGVKEGWGDDLGKLTKESDQWLSHVGVYNDYSKDRSSFIKSLNETFLRPFVYAGITAGKVVGAGMGGVQKATEEAGNVLDDQYRSNQPTIIPKPILGLGSEVLRATASGFIPDMPHFPVAARSQAVIGEGEAGFFNTHPLTEGNLQARSEAALETGMPAPKAEPPEWDINIIARQVNPDAFGKYDELLERQDNLRKSREYLKSLQETDTSSPTYDYTTQKEISDKLQDIPSQLLEIDDKIKGLVPDMADARERIRHYVESDSNESEIFRKYVQAELIKNAIERDNLEGPVRDAYVHAESLLPHPDIPSPEALQKPVEFKPGEDGRSIPAEENGAVEGPEKPPEGTIRLYHGAGEGAEKPRSTWVSNNYEYARNYNGGGVFYQDVPVSALKGLKNGELLPDPENGIAGLLGSFDLPGEYYDKFKPYETPAKKSSSSASAPNPKITKEDSLSADKGTGSGLKETPGTGKTIKVGLAKRIESQAIERGLTEGFETQERQRVSLAEQDKKIEELIKNDPQLAEDVALGLREAPEGLIPERVLRAVKYQAFDSGDLDLIRKLANSTLTRGTSEGALRLRALQDANKEDPVAAINAIQDARKQFKGEAKVNEAVQKLRDVVEKAPENMTQRDWNDFVLSIECDY